MQRKSCTSTEIRYPSRLLTRCLLSVLENGNMDSKRKLIDKLVTSPSTISWDSSCKPATSPSVQTGKMLTENTPVFVVNPKKELLLNLSLQNTLKDISKYKISRLLYLVRSFLEIPNTTLILFLVRFSII